jgi:archaellum component FlaC
MKEERITTDELAAMIKKGFDGVDTRFADLTEHVDKRFEEVNEHFERIEKLILADHKRRIERLEDEMKDLKSLLAIK